jgi:MFS family permease
MSLADIDLSAGRAGRIDCACGAEPGRAGFVPAERSEAETLRLSIGFGCAVLAQALMLSALPIAGADLAPRRLLANLPYAATLLGAAAASFPASLLLDRFGRRAAFALGASLGTAGGALAAFAILSRSFSALCVGALWLGIAQGFALFYRHAAAASRSGGSRAALTVLTGGCAASLVVPALIAFCRQAFAPFADAALMGIAGLASFAALPLLTALPHSFAERSEGVASDGVRSPFLAATALGAFAWFAMTHVMAGAPSALIACGLGAAATGGLISWHLLAMYGPMALAATRRVRPLVWPVIAPDWLSLSPRWRSRAPKPSSPSLS